MPRHISSVVPSAQTTYLSGMPSNDGSTSRSHCTCLQVTLTVSYWSTWTGLIGLVPWLSKSQIGMSRIVLASGVPGLVSILSERPSRCMWPATPRMVIGLLM